MRRAAAGAAARRHRRRSGKGPPGSRRGRRHGVKVWLDDVRDAPSGWTQARTPEEVIELLRSGTVTQLSLDHDLISVRRSTAVPPYVAGVVFRAPATQRSDGQNV